jgi:hypothetical protein
MATSPIPAASNAFSVAEERALQLEGDIAALDREYQLTRDSLLAAIASLRRKTGIPVTPNAPAPKAPKKPQKEVDRRKAVDDAVEAMPIGFNTSEVNQHIVTAHPALAPLLKNSYVPMRLGFLSKQGKIKKVKSGQRGEPSTWSKI